MRHDESDFRQSDIAAYAQYYVALVNFNLLASVAAAIVFLWLPLFAIGLLALRALTPLAWIVGKAQWTLKEGDAHPLKAVGLVISVLVFVMFVALFFCAQRVTKTDPQILRIVLNSSRFRNQYDPAKFAGYEVEWRQQHG